MAEPDPGNFGTCDSISRIDVVGGDSISGASQSAQERPRAPRSVTERPERLGASEGPKASSLILFKSWLHLAEIKFDSFQKKWEFEKWEFDSSPA